MGANLNIELYKKAYFYFDKPAEYQLKDKKIVYIYPIVVKDSEIFLSSMSVIGIDKNSSDSVEIIQMSYLDFIYKILFQDEINIDKFSNVLKYCLHINKFAIGYDDNNKPYLNDVESDIVIKYKDFENIRRIILYQNILRYDDEYVNPEIKRMMVEVDAVKNVGIDPPNIERKMAIVTAHCGISKQEQMAMTYRSHCLLFEEVYGEVEFTTVRPIMLYAGKGNEVDHWIYKKKKDKFDGYIVDTDNYAQSMGGDKNVIKSTTNTGYGDGLSQQINNFVNK